MSAFTATPVAFGDDEPVIDRRRRPQPSPPPLQSSVALVTGGGRGIGRLLATHLSDAGAAVGLVARTGSELAHTVHLIEAGGGTAEAVIADVADYVSIRNAVDTLQSRLGPIDLLINNAGILGPIGPLWEVDPDEWWATMDVNVFGTVLTSQRVLETMIARRRGRIINITSRAGTHRWPLVSGYSVSKAAVTKLTENLAHETKRYGVSVFSVHPGLLPIGMSEDMAGHVPTTPYEAQIRRWAMSELGSGHGAKPQEAVDLILRLAAGDGDALSGRHLSVGDDLDALVGNVVAPSARVRAQVAPVPLPLGTHVP